MAFSLSSEQLNGGKGRLSITRLVVYLSLDFVSETGNRVVRSLMVSSWLPCEYNIQQLHRGCTAQGSTCSYILYCKITPRTMSQDSWLKRLSAIGVLSVLLIANDLFTNLVIIDWIVCRLFGACLLLLSSYCYSHHGVNIGAWQMPSFKDMDSNLKMPKDHMLAC